MSATDWKTFSEFLIAFGSILGYVALALEVILHYADLKRWIMKPNFQLAMYPKGNFVSIVVTNAKTGNPLTDWRVCDATDCAGKLAIKKHETNDDRSLDVEETTPLAWEDGREIYRRLPAAPLPAYLRGFEFDPISGGVNVRNHRGQSQQLPISD